MSSSRFDAFDRVDLEFKSVEKGHLEATVFTPKHLPPGKYPILVHWHGGGFVVGHRTYEGWFPPWLIDLCLESSSIIITPDYRLLPESNAHEILSDVESFWTWLGTTFPSLSSTWTARPDLSRIACAGSSAGGYLAVQSSLLFPHLVDIKLLISMAGSLNTNIPHYSIPAPKMILGKRPPPPYEAERILRAYMKSIRPGAFRTSGDPVEMWDFLTCVLQQAYLPRWLGLTAGNKNEHLDAMKNLNKVADLPPVWLVQGSRDSVVPPVCSTGFAEKVRKVLPNVPVLLSLEDGDHGFEVAHTVDDAWVKEGLGFTKQYWP